MNDPDILPSIELHRWQTTRGRACLDMGCFSYLLDSARIALVVVDNGLDKAAGAIGLAAYSPSTEKRLAENPSSPSSADSKSPEREVAADAAADNTVFGADPRDVEEFSFREGSQTDRGFVVDDALETPEGRTLHFRLSPAGCSPARCRQAVRARCGSAPQGSSRPWAG